MREKHWRAVLSKQVDKVNCDKCSEGKRESLDIMRKNKVWLVFVLRNEKDL